MSDRPLRYCEAHGYVSHFETVPDCNGHDLDGQPCAWVRVRLVRLPPTAADVQGIIREPMTLTEDKS